MSDFVFRTSRVNKKEYLQVWEKLPAGKYEYKGSIGDAENAYKILVKFRDLKKFTKDLQEKFTKLQAENIELLTKLGIIDEKQGFQGKK